MREENHTWDELMFKEQYRKYYKILVIHALKIVADDSVAEDIVQDVFMGILRLKRTFADELQLRSYLYASVRNKALDHLKHKSVEQEFLAKSLDDTHASAYSLSIHGEEEFFSEEVYRRLFELVDSLPPRQREVFLKLMEGKKLREIADELNISFETVRTQKARGLNTLRKQMNPETMALLVALIG